MKMQKISCNCTPTVVVFQPSLDIQLVRALIASDDMSLLDGVMRLFV